ncbi:MAG: Ig-like domain-containing protein [Candidatus Coproplasma sp.]
MDKKKIKRIVATVMACASVSALAVLGFGCKKPADHTHTADTQWHTDENKHWHECTAGDGEKLNEGTHADNTNDGLCDTCGYQMTTPTPGDVAVTGVSLNQTTASLKMGSNETVTLTATVAPANATNTSVTWSSDNTSVATVENGVVTALSAGTAKITVTTADGGFTADCTVTVATADAEPPVDPPSGDYTTGVHTLTFTGDADIFTSSISVSSTDSGYNTTYFKVASGDYLYANMKLQKNKVIKVSGKAVTSNKTTAGKNTNLGVSLKDGSTGAVSGLPSPISFAQEDGEKAFSFELTVTTEGDIVLAFTRSSGSTGCEITELVIEITDSAPVAVTGITLNKTTGSLTIGSTETLTATVAPSNADNTDVEWSSSDSTVATVDANGKVTAIKKGTVTITAKAKGDTSKTASCEYTITNVMPSIVQIDRDEATIEIDGSITLIAIVSPDNTTVKTVTWSSSDDSIATVDANGKVTGLKTGTVTITATSTEDDTVKATCTVNVLAEIVKVTSVTLSDTTATIDMESATTHKLTATVLPDNASNKTVVWTTSDKTVATVDSTGLVTARKAGKVTITATADGVSATCEITITAPAPVAGAPTISLSSADELETAYVEWTTENCTADWFNVYYKSETASTWSQLDGALVRQYSKYYRADMVGLKAGTYAMKVVPVVSDAEDTDHIAYANGISVKAHDRTGFAFVNGTSSGAYNEDGTLKSNAVVLYITEQNKNSISMDVTGATANPCVGLQNILNGFKKGKDSRPLCVRMIGNITDMATMDKGDIVVDGNTQGVTIEGIGADTTVNGWGIRVKGSSNVEVRNLGFMNCDSSEGDCLGLQQDNDHVWVHNCDFFYGDAGSDADQAKGDGSLDTKTSTYVTHSYNRFWDSGKCNLQGMKSETVNNFITYHHNWYDHSDSRHPRIRTCTVHIYNNYFDGNAKYGVGVTMGASAFVENNYFRSTSTMRPMMSSGQGTDAQGEGTFSGETGGIIKSFGNVYTGGGSVSLKTYQQGGFNGNPNDSDCYEVSSRNETVPSSVTTVKGGTTYNNFDTASNMYSYTVESAEQAKASCERYSGRIDHGDFEWTFNNVTDDPYYGVDANLKSALKAYDDVIVKIGNVATGSSGESGGDSGSTGGDSGSTGGETGGETGGDSGSTTTPVEGEIIYIPSRDGYTGKDGITLSSQSTSNKASEDIYVLGYNVKAKTASKVDSNQHIKLTPSADATLKLYTLTDNLSVNGVKVTGVDEGDYYVITVSLTAGTAYDITKGDGENALYAVQLIPVA